MFFFDWLGFWIREAIYLLTNSITLIALQCAAGFLGYIALLCFSYKYCGKFKQRCVAEMLYSNVFIVMTFVMTVVVSNPLCVICLTVVINWMIPFASGSRGQLLALWDNKQYSAIGFWKTVLLLVCIVSPGIVLGILFRIANPQPLFFPFFNPWRVAPVEFLGMAITTLLDCLFPQTSRTIASRVWNEIGFFEFSRFSVVGAYRKTKKVLKNHFQRKCHVTHLAISAFQLLEFHFFGLSGFNPFPMLVVLLGMSVTALPASLSFGVAPVLGYFCGFGIAHGIFFIFPSMKPSDEDNELPTHIFSVMYSN